MCFDISFPSLVAKEIKNDLQENFPFSAQDSPVMVFPISNTTSNGSLLISFHKNPAIWGAAEQRGVLSLGAGAGAPK